MALDAAIGEVYVLLTTSSTDLFCVTTARRVNLAGPVAGCVRQWLALASATAGGMS
jgi:hypothetical protein